MNKISDLLQVLELEQIEQNIFRGQSHQISSTRVFGGQVLAQALQAAQLTVIDAKIAHSMHGYFILPGDVSKPIVYKVERLRDGRSFATRRVTAIQNGKAIFNMAASFQKIEEGFNHQISMPDVPSPDQLLSDTQLAEVLKDKIHPRTRAYLSFPRPIEFKPVVKDLSSLNNREPIRQVWMRSKGPMPDDIELNRMVLAYASDYNLLMTALQPHAVSFDKVMLASLDHAMWFHRSFKMDEWLLYALDSPSASNARGFTRGSIFNQKGELISSVVQEGLVRSLD